VRSQLRKAARSPELGAIAVMAVAVLICGAVNGAFARDPRAGGLAYAQSAESERERTSARPNASRRAPIASTAVTFAVRNTNRSAVACTSDGAPYEVKGHLVAPRSVLSRTRPRRRGVTLYLHGRAFGEFLWNFKSVRGQNYATAQARAGHASVVIDRIGYGASGHPDGNQSCLGSQADVAHQIVQKLRRGDYSSDVGIAPRFRRVALVGQSTGGQIANIEAYSFGDIDALIIVALSFQTSPRAARVFGEARQICLGGGEPSGPGGPGGYAYSFGQTRDDFEATIFRNATSSVVGATIGRRNRDPCGDILSVISALLRQPTALPKIKVPVLVICGANDALFVRGACQAQADRYTGSRSASLALVPNAGHAPMLERTAPTFRAKISRWLKRRRF
jgi:pimeloyl-ACP methyl ester carboxylesterase